MFSTIASSLPPPDSLGSLPHCGAGHLSLSLLGGTIGAWSCPSYIYRVPEGTLVRGGVGRQEREREEGEMLPWPIHKQMNSLRL